MSALAAVAPCDAPPLRSMDAGSAGTPAEGDDARVRISSSRTCIFSLSGEGLPSARHASRRPNASPHGALIVPHFLLFDFIRIAVCASSRRCSECTGARGIISAF
ncbi:hypothetical protein [Burkholderia latens]|uniref:Uncharacterized protein n=1 Tax=Burkholderia latens TaxID=488446 RepID=A0A6H9T368_9BURK|nr:hypothetical protein [Burkholderia latens]KAB0643517.1 hypothetical protein F7R21_06610 [Burkholderia latens]